MHWKGMSRSVTGLAILIFALALNPVVGQAAEGAPAATHLKMKQVKPGYRFSWTAVKFADYYVLMKDTKGNGNFVQVGERLKTTTMDYEEPIMDLMYFMDTYYRIDACNAHGCTPSNTVNVLSSSQGL